ncbi:hypothetical protein BH23CHL8_BH23CHL8_32030 [soil metagenome]
MRTGRGGHGRGKSRPRHEGLVFSLWVAMGMGLIVGLIPGTAAAWHLPDPPSDPPSGALAGLAGTNPERIVARLADPDTRGEAGAELLLWIRELSPERASLWLRLAVAMDRLPPEQVGSAAHAVLRCDPVVEVSGARCLQTARELRDAALELPPADQPVLLALASHLLEPEAPEEALALRRRYLAAGFEGPEAAEVVMAVARVLLGPPGAVVGFADGVGQTPADEARRILEDLLESTPEHPLAPEARRLRALALRMGGGAP